MQAFEANTVRKLSFDYLPAFCQFIFDNYLEEFVREQLQLSRKLELPLLKYFEAMPEDELMALSKTSNHEFLSFLAANKAEKQIENSINRWVTDQLPKISRDQIVAEDITLTSYVRKQAFLKFLPLFETDIIKLLELVKEIDTFILESETVLTNTYINLLKKSIDEQFHLNETIINTSPGITYVYDIAARKFINSNTRLEEYLGFGKNDIYEKDGAYINSLIHPGDSQSVETYEQNFQQIKDGEIRTVEYRIRNKQGAYRWMRNYESVFKRAEDGVPIQKIGIIIDVHNEKLISEQLQRREEQLLEAQELAEIGSYEWDLINHSAEVTPQVIKIFGKESSGVLGNFMANVHPADRAKVQAELDKAFTETGIYECEYRYLINGVEKYVWSRGKVSFDDGRAVSMKGTVMDITGRYQIMEQLRISEELHKQAQAITHIGNYTWDIEENVINWSDELYRIYGLIPQAVKITDELVASYNHPDDVAIIKAHISKSQKELCPFEFYYRIILPDETIKVLHAQGEVLADENDKPYRIFGTTQDVTERQNLISQLQHSEKLYKQAEAIAHIGNWNWDIALNKVLWSDEMYRIYGLEPQSEEINFERFLLLVHPDDRELLTNQVQSSLTTLQPYEIYHRIILDNGVLKFIQAKGEVLVDAKGKPYGLVGTGQDVTERQTLIQRLQRSEERYKQAQALAHIGNFTYNIPENKISWTDELYRIYGLEPQSEELSWERFLQLVHPADRKMISQVAEETIKKTEPFELYHRNLWANGTSKIVYIKGNVVADEEGKPFKLFGTIQDVTEQQLTEKELRENQKFIQKITDATPSIIASYNINTGKYRFISQGIEKLLGYTPEEVMEQGTAFFVNVIHPDDFGALMEKNAKALEAANAPGYELRNDIIEFKYRMLHKNGSYKWFHTYGTIFDRDSEGRVEHVLNVSVDITERLEAEQKVREQEYFIQQIAEASPTVLYLKDLKQKNIIYVNKEIFKVLGYTPEEIIEMGKNFTELVFHPDDKAHLPTNEQYTYINDAQSMLQYECRMKQKAGGWCWVLLREIVFRRNDEGGAIQVLGAALDISQRKDMEKSIFEKTLQLQQSNESLEEFAYVASHDLKEPLRKISTFGDRLLSSHKENLNNDGHLFLEKMIDSSKRMQTMIDDLLSISQISGNRSFENYSLQKILDEVLQTLEHKIESKGAVIKADELPHAHIIPSQFRQLFQNLLSNSLKFINEGKRPEIEITANFLNETAASQYNLHKAKNYLRLNFTDNGIGFDNKFSSKIFVIFQRLHGKTAYEGTGIGLAICKKIVEHHSGTIFAQGALNRGATFTIIIPV